MQSRAVAGALAGALCLGLTAFAPAAQAADVMVNVKRLSMEMALKASEATIEACREKGIQIAVTVVDRSGLPQVMLRDVLAPALTLPASEAKAWTALQFNAATSALTDRFEGPHSVGKLDRVVLSAGGLPITAAGNILGGIGVSGAPSGETDEECAQAGIDAIITDLEMAGF